MNNVHLSGEDIQLAMTEPEYCTKEQLRHLEICPDCAATMANYATIFSGLRELPVPVVSPRLKLAVMEKIENEKTLSKRPGTAIGLIAGFAVTAIAALALLNPELFRLAWSGLSVDMLTLIIFTVAPVSVFYGMVNHREHQRQMRLLENI